MHSLQALFPGAKQAGWVKNTIRLGGEPSKLLDLPGDEGLFPANFTADATLDEFYLWMDRGGWYNGGLWGVQQLWQRGRYYRPDDRDAEDARFTSGPIDLGFAPTRGPETGKRVLGISWTELAEDYDRTGTVMRPKLLDASTTPPGELRPSAAADINGYEGESVADLALEVDGVSFGPFRNPAYSPARTSKGAPPSIGAAGTLRYSAKLKIGKTGRAAPVLLATPVIDDVTIFFDDGGPKILGWISP